MSNFENRNQEERDLYMGKMMWVVNFALDKTFFKGNYVSKIEAYMHKYPNTTVKQLLETNEYSRDFFK